MRVPPDMSGVIEFLKTCTDMELVQLQAEARAINDGEMLKVVLEELGRRQRKNG